MQLQEGNGIVLENNRWILGAVFMVVPLVLGLDLACGAGAKDPSSGEIQLPANVEDFVAEYWRTPIPLQGAAPESFGPEEAALNPEACGSCHPDQYRDWQQSLHSKAMGPGPWGQIVDSFQHNPGEAVLCMSCHAPLSEQYTALPTTTPQGTTYTPNAELDQKLQLRGITCAACHVRAHRRFGPPRAAGEAAKQYPKDMGNHAGVRRTKFFESAEFCRGCHQFDVANTLLINGKPLQDTYREWRASTWGQGGAVCQGCHMPERRHLWKGIHDPDMVKNGVRVETTATKTVDNRVNAAVKVTNAAVGHKFPSYVTPKVFVYGAFLNAQGALLENTIQEAVIGWDARPIGGQWQEIFDTRIEPGKSFEHTFTWQRVPPTAKKLRTWIEVHPDHFYHVHFYPAYLQSSGLSPEGRKLIEQALEESGKSVYVIHDQSFPL